MALRHPFESLSPPESVHLLCRARDMQPEINNPQTSGRSMLKRTDAGGWKRGAEADAATKSPLIMMKTTSMVSISADFDSPRKRDV